MIIYLDLVFILIWITNYIMIASIESMTHTKMSFVRASISNLLLISLYMLYIYPFKIGFKIRFILGIPIGLISFRGNIKTKIFKTIIYYLLNLNFIAAIYLFNVKNIIYTILICIIISILGILKNFNLKKEAIIYIDKQKIKCLYDTGNMTYYCNIPVIYLDNKYFNNLFKYIGTTVVATVVTKNLIDIYEGPIMYYQKSPYHVYYAFTDLSKVNGLIHAKIGG
jgi:hypothetical protein